MYQGVSMQSMNMIKGGLVFFALAAGAGLVRPAVARSDSMLAAPRKDVRWSGLTVNRDARVEVAQDSNIYLSKTATGSLIVKPGAGIGFAFERPRGTIGIGYDLQLLLYGRYSRGNNAVHQTGTLQAGYEFRKDSRVAVTDRFMSTTDQASNELTGRTRRNQNNAGLDVDAALGRKQFIGIAVDHVLHRYLDAKLSDIMDRGELTIAPRAGLLIGPKTRGYLKFALGNTAYDDKKLKKDSSTQNYLAGVNGEISARITGTAEAGFFTRSYKDSSTIFADPKPSPTVNVGLKWVAPRGVNVALSASRGMAEAVWGRYSVSTGVNLGVGKNFGPKLTAGIVGGFSSDAYEERSGAAKSRRTDRITQGGVNVGYEVRKNIRLKLADLYRARGSDFEEFKYSDNVVTARVFAAF